MQVSKEVLRPRNHHPSAKKTTTKTTFLREKQGKNILNKQINRAGLTVSKRWKKRRKVRGEI